MCLAPIRLKTDDGLSYMVRCGRCRPCRIRRKQAWVGRLRLESLCHEYQRFLTLTYRKEDVPEKLPVKHLQDFLKRYRYYYGPCRYFAVGEYGEKNLRPHWHLIIYGQPPIPAAIGTKHGAPWEDNKAWSLGYSWDGEVTPDSIGYVSGYTLKGTAKHEREFRPFCRQSLKPGIGFSRIAAFARAAAVAGVPNWPSSYRIGVQQYPLCDGGLAAFQSAYLESGGVPPTTWTPEIRDLEARLAVSDWGPRIEAEKRAESSSYTEVVDVFKTQKTKAR